MGRQSDARNFFEQIRELFDEGIEEVPEDIKIGDFGADKGDDVNEQYGLMQDYFQEVGMEMDDPEEKIKTVKCFYTILVWDNIKKDYVEWGTPQKSREIVVNMYQNYMNDAIKTSNQWNNYHKYYAYKPYKVRETIVTSFVEEKIIDERKLNLPQIKITKKNKEER